MEYFDQELGFILVWSYANHMKPNNSPRIRQVLINLQFLKCKSQPHPRRGRITWLLLTVEVCHYDLREASCQREGRSSWPFSAIDDFLNLMYRTRLNFNAASRRAGTRKAHLWEELGQNLHFCFLWTVLSNLNHTRYKRPAKLKCRLYGSFPWNDLKGLHIILLRPSRAHGHPPARCQGDFRFPFATTSSGAKANAEIKYKGKLFFRIKAESVFVFFSTAQIPAVRQQCMAVGNQCKKSHHYSFACILSLFTFTNIRRFFFSLNTQ